MKQALMSAVLLSGLALVSTASASRGKDVFVPGQPLQQQIARIEVELKDGETYSELKQDERTRVNDALARMRAAVEQYPARDSMPEPVQTQVFNDQQVVNTVLTQAREDSRLICQREKPIGSNRTTTQCMTVAERARQKERAQQDMRQVMRAGSTVNYIAANLGDYLEDRGHTVDFAADGVTGLHLAVVHEFDAIVLDLNLPGMDGIEVCRKLRNEARKQTPVLMLTARDSLDNKLAGFESGADDYLIKPFALQEVEVRLNALSRRGKGVQTRVLETGDLEYNLDTLEVRRQGKLLQLNPTALKILQALMEAAPAVVTRQELETRVWGEELPDSDSLRVHIHGLRAVVDKPFEVPLIQTRHGIGYRIATPEA